MKSDQAKQLFRAARMRKSSFALGSYGNACYAGYGKGETSEATPLTSETAVALNDAEIGEFIEEKLKHIKENQI